MEGGSSLGNLSERLHERLVVLHAASSIDQSDVKLALACGVDRFSSDPRGVLPVALLEELDPLERLAGSVRNRRVQSVQFPRVGAQLLDSTRTERVAGSDQHAVLVLD